MTGPTPTAVPRLAVRGGTSDDLNALLTSTPVLVITGSRAATSYGQYVADQLASYAARAGATLMCGGSYGIEEAAIGGALTARGRAVIAQVTGINRYYPSGVQERINRAIDAGGMTLSTFNDDAGASRANCQQRDELIARVAGAVIIVESSLRSSALRLARLAHELGKPVYAVPGPVTSITSNGPHELIREGTATLLRSFSDVENLHTLTGSALEVADASA